jgi:hypothetical protein
MATTSVERLADVRDKVSWRENPFSHPQEREPFPVLFQDGNPTKSACGMGIAHERELAISHERTRPVMPPYNRRRRNADK